MQNAISGRSEPSGQAQDSPDQSAGVIAICTRYGNNPRDLLEILHDIQHELGFVPQSALPVIAHALNLSRAEVYGVQSFYHDFRKEPAGRHVLKLCMAEACQSMGAKQLAAGLERSLGVTLGQTSRDGAVTLESVYCLGNCALAPAAMLDGKLLGRANQRDLAAAVRQS